MINYQPKLYYIPPIIPQNIFSVIKNSFNQYNDIMRRLPAICNNRILSCRNEQKVLQKIKPGYKKHNISKLFINSNLLFFVFLYFLLLKDLKFSFLIFLFFSSLFFLFFSFYFL